jgi:hypothetical protein
VFILRLLSGLVTLHFGLFVLVFGLLFSESPTEVLWVLVLASFWFAVAAACLTRRGRSVTLPITVAGFVACWPLSAVRSPGELTRALLWTLLVFEAVYLYFRWAKDCASTRAARMARDGNVDGAITLLQGHIVVVGGSVPAYATLAVLFCERNALEEALPMVHNAEKLGLNGVGQKRREAIEEVRRRATVEQARA